MSDKDRKTMAFDHIGVKRAPDIAAKHIGVTPAPKPKPGVHAPVRPAPSPPKAPPPKKG